TEQQAFAIYDVSGALLVPHESRREARMLTRCRMSWTPATTAHATVSTRVAASPPAKWSHTAAKAARMDSSTAWMMRWKRSAAAALRARASLREANRSAASSVAATSPDRALAT